jgi:flagellar biosynthesis GTPase FlhF
MSPSPRAPAAALRTRASKCSSASGVGKTTTIAKIAAQERLAGRARAADRGGLFASGRRGALEGYAGIIGSPFRIARDARN